MAEGETLKILLCSPYDPEVHSEDGWVACKCSSCGIDLIRGTEGWDAAIAGEPVGVEPKIFCAPCALWVAADPEWDEEGTVVPESVRRAVEKRQGLKEGSLDPLAEAVEREGMDAIKRLLSHE